MTQLHWCKHQAMTCITPRGGVEARPIDLDKKRPSQTVGRLRWRRLLGRIPMSVFRRLISYARVTR